jgi:signal transduction histidine kinase
VRWAVIVAGVAVISLVSLVAIYQALRGPGGGAEFDYTVLPLVLILLTVSMISAGVGFTRTVSAVQDDVRAQLSADIDRLHWELARLKQEIWLERRELALALHGPLRAALVSSAMELGQHSGPLRDELVSKLHQRIVDARSRLSEPRAKEGLLETWKALKDLWQGSCSITWSIDASTLSRLEKDPLALRSLQQISDEACANAITHANPSCIEIDVVSRESVLEVTVVNDGATSQVSAREGLGSLLLNDVCLDWEFFVDGDRAFLRASLPIAPQ